MQSILITGAYGGMGKSAVAHFKTKGFRIFALDRKTEAAEENVIPIEADLTDPESVKNAFRTVSEQTDSLFAIIHFAGIYMLDSLVEMPYGDFKKAFEVNVFGAFLVNREFLPLLKSGSRILITTSELAPLAPLPFTGLYAVTKSALDGYAYSLAMELQLLGISVSVLRAGAVDTGMIGVSTDALDRFVTETALYSCNAERFKRIVDGVEAKKIPPEKIARKADRILSKKKPRFVHHINRNPLLLLLNALPRTAQLAVIRKILEP
jgi:NAD(P)-dependent dehydrogenase (short-subunit alcohol dehydrogenase family)